MSHQPQRKEKDCLNCGTIVYGPYCHVCGQENIVIKQHFISLVKHFIYDVFHFDGKFFDTLKYLVTRPGYIPQKFLEGKRQSFLDPIRMYLFTSAVFFLVFFSVKNVGEYKLDPEDIVTLSRNDRLVLASRLLEKNDTAKLNKVIDTAFRIQLHPVRDSLISDSSSLIQWKGSWYVMKSTLFSNIITGRSNSEWVSKRVDKTWQEYRLKYGDNTEAMLAGFSDTFLHKLPYILFVSLPFFALILKLLYIRKNRLFSEHAIFTLYHYIFSFILLLFFFLLGALKEWTGWSLFDIINVVVLLSGGVYLLISMKRFYKQSKGKTVLKFILLNILGFFTLMLIMVFFLIFSIIQL